ncbi:MAG TPA: DUF4190 domain-containing protein [Armatimonadota bacterium]|jgi:prepilin-type processing-associated H-X9-DG protein|nr:DUF4190 domain-containing protein [Armatimonadota bacterium]HPP73761.1 DUF4190 domain-containing protein [Armatimonadota bacterium]
MRCPKCGAISPENSIRCVSCGQPLPDAPVHGTSQPAQPVQVKNSGMAIAALVLGILTLFSCGLLALPALIVSIVALVQINKSQGQLKGQGQAIGGLVLSAGSLLLVPIMVAILFPVFARARDAARMSSCQLNIKQIGVALQMYAVDYGETLPSADKWSDAMPIYLKDKDNSRQIFKCPSSPDSRPEGYLLNERLSGINTAVLPSPSNVYMIFEGNGFWNAYGGPGDVDYRHNSYTNVCFIDGRVIKTKKVYEKAFDPDNTEEVPEESGPKY